MTSFNYSNLINIYTILYIIYILFFQEHMECSCKSDHRPVYLKSFKNDRKFEILHRIELEINNDEISGIFLQIFGSSKHIQITYQSKRNHK